MTLGRREFLAYSGATLLSAAAGKAFAQSQPGEVRLDEVKLEYDGPPIKLRLSHFAPATHPLSNATSIRWADQITKETGGKITIEKYYGGVLHAAKDGFKAAVNDITDITPAYVMYQPKSFDLAHVLDLPFAFPNTAVAVKVAEELYPKYFKKEYEAMGVYMANFNANGAYNLFSKRAVTKLEDIKGMKLRSAGGISSKMLKALGAVPTSVPAPEAYNAFQRGVVDGVVFYNTGAIGYRVHELATDMTELGLNHPANAWAWNRKTWDNLPPEVKKYMYLKMRQLSMLYGIEFDRHDIISRQKFVDQGMRIHQLDPKEMERWRAAVEPLWEEFIQENEAKGLPARQLVADLRALVEKYETWTTEQLMKEVVENPVRGIIDGM